MFSKFIAAMLLVSGTLFALQATAQEKLLQITYGVKSDRNVEFEFEKQDPGTHTVILTFSQLSNSSEREKQVLTVKGYSGPLLTLRPENKDKQIGFSYKYTYLRGKLNPGFDPKFVYLLPYKAGTSVKVAEAGFFNATYFGSTTPEDWKYYRFYTAEQDSVTVVRKGIVVEVKSDADDLAADYSYTSNTNYVRIEHADGTMATYNGLKKGSITVKPGITVYPGDVLGLNTPQGSDQRWNIGLTITYLKSTDVEASKKQGLKESKSLYGFVFPYFHVKDAASMQLVPRNEYIVAQTSEIIKKEFTKKELKQNIR